LNELDASADRARAGLLLSSADAISPELSLMSLSS
jgi:hypothetical protein